jgi:hypothetical protein
MRIKRNYYFLLATLIFIGFSCDKKDEVTCVNNCMETYLKQNNMVSYKGGEIGCKKFVSLYEYQKKQYYVLGSHCADVASNPTDCSGITLCESGNEKVCNDFFANAKHMGIVGIEA